MSKRNINRNAVKWNTLSGLINAGQSAVILVFISHFYDVRTAGTFTIAYAMANLFMTMGKYGVRNYQVTDIKNHFSFEEYHYQRILTVIGSFLILLAYLAFQYFSGGYSLDKTMIVLLVCLWKYVDAIEDVYYGMYQQQGRLYIGAKCYSLRLMASMLVMCVLLLLKVNFLITMIIVIIVSVILALVLIKASVGRFEVNHERYMTSILAITRICFPLFIGNSLSMFLGNSPKYLVDWYLDDGYGYYSFNNGIEYDIYFSDELTYDDVVGITFNIYDEDGNTLAEGETVYGSNISYGTNEDGYYYVYLPYQTEDGLASGTYYIEVFNPDGTTLMTDSCVVE